MMRTTESSLSDIRWTEEQIIEYDELALEDHSSCIATREECIRNEKLGSLVEYKKCSRTTESISGFR